MYAFVNWWICGGCNKWRNDVSCSVHNNKPQAVVTYASWTNCIRYSGLVVFYSSDMCVITQSWNEVVESYNLDASRRFSRDSVLVNFRLEWTEPLILPSVWHCILDVSNSLITDTQIQKSWGLTHSAAAVSVVVTTTPKLKLENVFLRFCFFSQRLSS